MQTKFYSILFLFLIHNPSLVICAAKKGDAKLGKIAFVDLDDLEELYLKFKNVAKKIYETLKSEGYYELPLAKQLNKKYMYEVSNLSEVSNIAKPIDLAKDILPKHAEAINSNPGLDPVQNLTNLIINSKTIKRAQFLP